MLYDLTSTYFEGGHCKLAHLGHSRDDRGSKPQIVFGLLTNAEGCPVAVEVFEGISGISPERAERRSAESERLR